MRTLALTVLLAAACGVPAFAHGGPDSAALPWTFDFWIVGPLVVVAVCYAAGSIALLWRGRDASARMWPALAFLLGWLTLAGALISPLHWLGERIFTIHMIEHEIVMAISAPLFVLAKPIGILMWGLPERLRQAMGGWAGHAMTRVVWNWFSAAPNATLLHGAAIWLWHVPVFFDAAITNVSIHRLQHLSFLFSALIFWWSVLRRCEHGAASWSLFITMMHTSVLGALMTLAPRVLYQAQTRVSAEWGLTPLQDQQLAGVVMWVPAGTIYAGAALALAALWIRQSGQKLKASDP
jgi:putative membrane protein